MDELMGMPAAWQAAQVTQALQRVNSRLQGHSLVLTEAETAALVRRRAELLRGAGRIEFGEGVLPKLVFAFSDCPYIEPGQFAATIEALLESFYHFKAESGEQAADDELIAFMKRHLDGDCHGSVEYLNGTLLEAYSRELRLGQAGQTADDEADGEVDDDDAW